MNKARENICQLQATVQEKDMLLQDIGAALQTRLREVRESQARTWSMVHMSAVYSTTCEYLHLRRWHER